ncbi:hypothetical protein GLYMA_13G096700v4 [Glycine max]|nr:uncharacterized protein LOC112998779 [Glycine max]KAG4383484.1 hypothetical protein GLYMA_13G096700v4 [Glycine max]KAG4976462.1 hypothetical protein JHK86_035936 [Glycine max]|eukprot:XP_025980898.1 uncharacterized protein LOC112998779 [Glycine max]
MDFEYQNMSMSKILSRRSSMGSSSRISYYRSSGEGVPFKWEMQPGIAKEQQPREDLPPLSPPPALLSLGLPKPCIPDTKPSTRSRLRFWKKRVKRGKSKKSSSSSHDCFHEDDDVIGLDILDCNSDSESNSMASPRGSSFSSWSSMSFMKSPTTTIRKVYRRPSTLGCFPMHVTRVFVSIARRD